MSEQTNAAHGSKWRTVGEPEQGRFVRWETPGQELEDVGEGALIRIVYEGQRTSKAGRAYKDFTVQVADEGDPA